MQAEELVKALNLGDHIIKAKAIYSVLKSAMRRALDASGLSRDQATDIMNAISLAIDKRLTAGRKATIHKDTLDKWLNPDEADHVPNLMAMHVFCLAVGSYKPLVAWLSVLGMDAELMTEEDRHYRDIGRSLIEMEQAKARHEDARNKLKGGF